MQQCPCHSGKKYQECCGNYHAGALPENALALMRSRYSAYALGNAEYIIATTHPENPVFTSDQQGWKKNILEFSKNTRFEGLKVEEFIDGTEVAFVTFTAVLRQNGQDATFTEKSRFFRVGGRWLYRDGEMTSR